MLKRMVVLGLVLIALALFSGPSLAQDAPQAAPTPTIPPIYGAEGRQLYQDWLRLADRAEEVVDANRASTGAMEYLRADLVDYREIFAEVRTENSARIQTLQAQIASLPPVPEEGASEPEDIAALRANLNARMDALQVPRIVADEALSRANGLILEVDRIIRQRNRDRLLIRGPSPLIPDNWALLFHDLSGVSQSLVNEVQRAWALPSTHENLRANAAPILVLMAFGALLLLRGGRWIDRLCSYFQSLGKGGTGRAGVWSFVLSLGRAVVPFMGVVLIARALDMTDIAGLRGQIILEALPRWTAIFVIFHWIGDRTISQSSSGWIASLSPARVAELRVQADLLALMLVLWDMVALFDRVENVSDASRGVATFPIIVATALILLRLQLARGAPLTGALTEDKASGFEAFLRLARRLLLVLALAAPVLAAAGYAFAAEALIFPIVQTLALISVVVILQQVLGDLAAWLSRKPELARDSLFTVIAGFVLSLLAVPALVLIWGGRMASLTEIWTRFMAGVRVGDTTFSPETVLSFALIFTIGYGITRLVQSGLRNNLLPKTSIDPGGQNAIVSGLGYVGIFIAGLVAVTGAGLDLSSLAIVAGALSVGIGFGLQTIVSNFVSGIILLVERPVSKGDWIEVGGMMGYVRDISVRSTRIETFDRTDVIVPNSDLISGTVTNYTRGNTVGRVIVSVGVAYGTDTRKVETILMEIAQAHPMVLANPGPSVVFQGFGADALEFEIRAILRDVNWVLSVKSDMNHEIAKRFVAEGIEIPFAQRDIWLRNPEALAQGKAPAPEQS